MCFNFLQAKKHFQLCLVLFKRQLTAGLLYNDFGRSILACCLILRKLASVFYDGLLPNSNRAAYFSGKANGTWRHVSHHGLRTPNEGINQRNLKIWPNVADKICFGRN